MEDGSSSGVQAFIRPELKYAWRGSSLLVVDNAGCADAAALNGYFFRQTRFLCDLQLTLNGRAPHLCSLAQTSPNTLEFAHNYPPVEHGGAGGSGSGGLGETEGLLFRTLDLRTSYTVHPASVQIALTITNRWPEHAEFDLAWRLGADYTT